MQIAVFKATQHSRWHRSMNEYVFLMVQGKESINETQSQCENQEKTTTKTKT